LNYILHCLDKSDLDKVKAIFPSEDILKIETFFFQPRVYLFSELTQEGVESILKKFGITNIVVGKLPEKIKQESLNE